jgi:hypothetical protein
VSVFKRERRLGVSLSCSPHPVQPTRSRRARLPVISESTAHILHIVGWVLGAIDVGIVGMCLFFVQKGGH